MNEHPGRAALASWRDSKPTNFFRANPNLAAVLRLLAGDSGLADMHPRLDRFGALTAGPLNRLADDCERLENLPVLRRWSGLGERTEAIEFHPSYVEAGRLVWEAGIIAVQREPGHALEQAALIYMLAHNGEGGHACPVACTAGLVKALQAYGSEELRRQYLTRLLDRDYATAHVGSQFLTEVQGGSDVGANLVEAVPDPRQEGVWRITGEKWFCSVANADQFLVTARVRGQGGGTGGLGTFLVPRRLEDGSVNAFQIRRLKTKLGTRAMASAEIDFDGATAYAIGNVRNGFKIAAGVVLNTSRWINALGSTGVMRRAYLEAVTYAAARQAFGGPIGRYPLVRETLATMKCEEAAAVASTFYLTALIDALETNRATEHEKAVYRFLVNANKYVTSIAATEVAHGALEVLGGNGAIEDFSPVPRLLRDNFVFESWEGTHNVLAMQVLRDCAKLGLFANVHDELTTLVQGLGDDRLRADAAAITTRLAHLSGRISRSLTQPAYGAQHFRRQLTELTRLFQAARLLHEADRERAEAGGPMKAAIAAFFIRRHVRDGYRPDEDPQWQERIDLVLGGDLPIGE